MQQTTKWIMALALSVALLGIGRAQEMDFRPWGWNTWDNRSVLHHVLLPDGLAVQLQLVDTVSGDILQYAFTGNKVEGTEQVRTLAHTPDGSYTALQLEWRRFRLQVHTLADGADLYLKIVPEKSAFNPGYIRVEPVFMYGRNGEIGKQETGWAIQTAYRKLELAPINLTGNWVGNALDLSLQQPFWISTQALLVQQANARLAAAQTAYWERREQYGAAGTSWHIIQNAVNWNVVYDPVLDRAVTPVARTWSYGWGQRQEGGFVQFCWDNFFVAYMHALESRALAFNEVEQLTRLIDTLGFVPNYAGPGAEYSRDRSQPPVGSIMVKEVFKLHPDTAFLAAHFDRLLRWNRWWEAERAVDGYLAWGSNAYAPAKNKRQATQHNHAAASNESGLDNTPMYDGVPFDTARNVLMQADVGLMSLYIADCDALAEMAAVLGQEAARQELENRAGRYRSKLRTFWHEPTGLFLNKRLDTGDWSFRLGPTHFYPLLAKAATPKQAERMINEHFYNPEEFWGDYILPSAARNDTAYTARDYWRGSIWAPMNFLTYLGLRNYHLQEARADLASRSLKLLVKNWEAQGWVLENYHAETGGYPGYRSEYFYHWGALLGMINLIEKEAIIPPERTLQNP